MLNVSCTPLLVYLFIQLFSHNVVVKKDWILLLWWPGSSVWIERTPPNLKVRDLNTTRDGCSRYTPSYRRKKSVAMTMKTLFWHSGTAHARFVGWLQPQRDDWLLFSIQCHHSSQLVHWQRNLENQWKGKNIGRYELDWDIGVVPWAGIFACEGLVNGKRRLCKKKIERPSMRYTCHLKCDKCYGVFLTLLYKIGLTLNLILSIIEVTE